jgi:hypothetical protein
MAALFGTTWREDVSYSSDGRTTTRLPEEPQVFPTWLKSLPTAHAWFHGAPIGRNAHERIGLLVVATPPRPNKRARLALPPGQPPVVATDEMVPVAGPPPGPPPTAEELARAAVRRLVGPVRQDGCREWRGSYDKDGYGRAWYHDRKRQAHRLLALWEHGEFPRSWEVDHTCRHRWCVEITHLEPTPRAEHRRREAERRQAAEGEASVAMTDERGQSETAPNRPQAERRNFTPRERRAEVQRLRQGGWSLRRIAAELGISYGTAHSAAKEAINTKNTGDQQVDQRDQSDQLDQPPWTAAPAASEIDSDGLVVRAAVSLPTSAAGESHRLADTFSVNRMGFGIALFEGIDRHAMHARTRRPEPTAHDIHGRHRQASGALLVADSLSRRRHGAG